MYYSPLMCDLYNFLNLIKYEVNSGFWTRQDFLITGYSVEILFLVVHVQCDLYNFLNLIKCEVNSGFWTRQDLPMTGYSVRDHVSQPYSTTGNIIVLYILIFKFLEKSRRQKCLDWIITWISSFKSTFYFFMNRFVNKEPKY